MVASTPNTIHPFGEEDSSKRRQILDGARKVFMDLGFDGASMNEIARSAGVSKGTLYVYFADKSRLFEAIVEDEALEKSKITYNLDPKRDAEITLREFGRAYIGSICRPGGGSSIRTVMAIAERMPEVGRQFYENVLDDLAIDDCGLAAAQFLNMCQATLFLPFVFQAEPTPSAERIAHVVDSATRVFLQTYRAKPV
jgi:AcrR family transcriptional regulator